MRGSVMDMAVVIIGAAFGTIVKSLVDGIIMLPFGLLLGNVDFSNLFVLLKENPVAGSSAALADAKEAGAVSINYDAFVMIIITFLIIALDVFLLIHSHNKMRREEEAPPEEPTTKYCPHSLSAVPIEATRCAFSTSELGSV